MSAVDERRDVQAVAESARKKLREEIEAGAEVNEHVWNVAYADESVCGARLGTFTCGKRAGHMPPCEPRREPSKDKE